MTLAIMQPYLFPYIGYFQLVKAVEKFIIYDDVAFIKQGWINRNTILVNKQRHSFFVPVKAISSFKKISETEIDYKSDWTKKTLLTLEQSYKKAPYFNDFFPVMETVFKSKKNTISEMAIDSIIHVSNYLELTTTFEQSSIIYNNQALKGKERVIDICLKEKAKHYINPIGGQELYSKEEFLSHNICLNFLKTQSISYKQFNNEFIPWLSIIDVLMFNSKEEARALLDNYELL